jgi:hypothetical protein
LETQIFKLQSTTFGFLIERRVDLLVKKINIFMQGFKWIGASGVG